ncbi:hypothetical protein ACP275_03G022400 [Erythranthe tilingii]
MGDIFDVFLVKTCGKKREEKTKSSERGKITVRLEFEFVGFGLGFFLSEYTVCVLCCCVCVLCCDECWRPHLHLGRGRGERGLSRKVDPPPEQPSEIYRSQFCVNCSVLFLTLIYFSALNKSYFILC